MFVKSKVKKKFKLPRTIRELPRAELYLDTSPSVLKLDK